MNTFLSRIFRATLVGLLIGAGSAPLMAARRKVIIDQDAFGPGGPNLQPILMVLQSPDVEVLGITIESGDGWQKENVAHTLRMLEIIGRPDIPVVAGATLPLLNTPEATQRWEARFGRLVYKGAWTEQWPPGSVNRRPVHSAEEVPPSSEGEPLIKPLPGSAASYLVRKIREFPGEVSILALGPLTNIAVATKLDERFAGLAREIVIMGGSFNPRVANNEFGLEYLHNPRLEFNFRWDPEAAALVLRAPWKKVTLVPVDPTTKTLVKPELIKRIAAADTPVARYVSRHLEGFPMWDETGVAVWLLEPSMVARKETVAVGVDTNADGAGYGSTLSWPAGTGPGLGERPVDVVFDVDVPALEKLMGDLLTRPAQTVSARTPAVTNLEAELMAQMTTMTMLTAPGGPKGPMSAEVKIPPTALEVLTGIVNLRRGSGRWPKGEEIPLPTGVKAVTLSDVSEVLEVAVEYAAQPAFRCRVFADGSIVLRPPLAEIMRLLQTARKSVSPAPAPTPPK